MTSVQKMNDFIHSCNAAATYPQNLISSEEYQHNLQEYVEQLNQREPELFDTEDKAYLEFWDLDEGASGNFHARIGSETAFGTNNSPQFSSSPQQIHNSWKTISTFRHRALESIRNVDMCSRTDSR